MTTAFRPQGSSAVISYADDSTDTSITLAPGSTGVPNALFVTNPDAANVIVVNYSFDSQDTNAIVPTSGANGLGVVVAPGSSVLIGVDSSYQSGNLYVSAAGVSATGVVYVSPGVI